MPSSNKRKIRKCLTLQDKNIILSKIQEGIPYHVLAERYGVTKATIGGIKRCSSKIKTAVASTFLGPAIKKTLRRGEYSRMEDALYKWFLRQRERNVPVNGELLRAKALYFFDKYKTANDKFNASEGWMHNFKKRFGIRFLKICGEKLSSQPQLVEPFKVKLAEKIKEMELVEEQIYNADETALFWKLIPEKTFVSKDEKTAPGRKISKERITFLVCTNANGQHKLKPLLI